MVVKLDPRDFYVKPDIGEGTEGLPWLAFWDKDVLAHEFETIFRGSWLCVPKQLLREHNPAVRSIFARPEHGRSYSDIIKLRGNDVEFRILGEKVMLMRGTTPKGMPLLRCFANACPHGGYPLREGSYDTSNEFRKICQQHGLTVDEYGNFIGHPAFPKPSEEQKKKLCLRLYPHREWFDFFFISRGEPAVSFEEVMRPVFDSIAHLPMEQFKYKKLEKEQRIVDGNWKLHAQNYNDWLHIRFIHKKPNGLADAVDISSARMELYKHASLMWAYAANPEDGFDPQYLPERFRDSDHPEKRVFALWWFIFPNLTLNFYPWGLSVNMYMPAMVNTDKMEFDPEKLEFLWYHYLWDEKKYHEGLEARWLNTVVDDEDIEAIRYVAESLRSHSHPWERGLFGPGDGPNTERGPHWLHRTIYEAMFPAA